jgi:hypothetical protein
LLLAGFESALSRAATGNAIGNNAQKTYVAIDCSLLELEVRIALSNAWEMEANIVLFATFLFFVHAATQTTPRYHDEADIFAMFSITERRNS